MKVEMLQENGFGPMISLFFWQETSRDSGLEKNPSCSSGFFPRAGRMYPEVKKMTDVANVLPGAPERGKVSVLKTDRYSILYDNSIVSTRYSRYL